MFGLSLGNLSVAIGADVSNLRKNLAVAKTGLKDFSASAMKFAGVGTLSIASLGLAVKKVTGAYAEQEKAVSDLEASLGGSGLTKELTTYAGELQNATKYGDEFIISQMAYAKNLGVSEKSLKKTTKAAIGLATKLRIDLKTAMMLMGRASFGQTAMLTRYGVVLDENLKKEQKYDALLKIGIDNFKLAEAETGSLAGATDQATNAFGDFLEELGRGIAGDGRLTRDLKELTGMFNDLKDSVSGVNDFISPLQKEGMGKYAEFGAGLVKKIIGNANLNTLPKYLGGGEDGMLAKMLGFADISEAFSGFIGKKGKFDLIGGLKGALKFAFGDSVEEKTIPASDLNTANSANSAGSDNPFLRNTPQYAGLVKKGSVQAYQAENAKFGKEDKVEKNTEEMVSLMKEQVDIMKKQELDVVDLGGIH